MIVNATKTSNCSLGHIGAKQPFDFEGLSFGVFRERICGAFQSTVSTATKFIIGVILVGASSQMIRVDAASNVATVQATRFRPFTVSKEIGITMSKCDAPVADSKMAVAFFVQKTRPNPASIRFKDARPEVPIRVECFRGRRFGGLRI